MIWATVSSQSCFCWLYRASPSLTAKNIMSDFGIDHLVMSICRVASGIVGKGCLLWPVHSLGKTLLAFTLLHSLLPRPHLPVTPGVSWLPTFAFLSPIMKKTSFGDVSSRRSVGLYRTIQLQLLQHYWLGHRLGLQSYWMVSLGNQQRSFCHYWDCIQVPHFGLFCWLWWPFFLRDSCPQ